jgi:hypothetical protein
MAAFFVSTYTMKKLHEIWKLKRGMKNMGCDCLLGSFASGCVPLAGCCEYDSEHSGSIKGLNFSQVEPLSAS